MDVLRGNLGKAPQLLAAQEGREPMVVLSVAETVYAPPTAGPDGKPVWEEPDTVWHNDVIVRGEQAKKFADTFDKGDAVLLIGIHGKSETRTLDDGREVQRKPFWVSAYGPDATRMDVVVNRTPKGEAAADQTQQVQQHAAQTSQQARTLGYSEARAILEVRLEQLHQNNWISEGQSSNILHQFDHAYSPESARLAVAQATAQNRVSDVASLYINSVMDETVGEGQRLTWAEAQSVAEADFQHGVADHHTVQAQQGQSANNVPSM